MMLGLFPINAFDGLSGFESWRIGAGMPDSDYDCWMRLMYRGRERVMTLADSYARPE